MFPVLATYSKVSKEQMWENLKQLTPVYREIPWRWENYDTKFNGRYVVIDSSDVDYFAVEGLTDWYTELERMKVKRGNRPLSPFDFWRSRKWNDKPERVREVVFKQKLEATLFRLSWAKGILMLIRSLIPRDNIKVLDPCSGWGDRVIACMSLGYEYEGYDTNHDLRPGHSAAIRDFAGKAVIHYQPFEDSNPGKADIVFTSPPFFDLEIYHGKESSTTRYPTFDRWMSGFYMPMLAKAWDAVLPGGFMVIHISNWRNDMVGPMYEKYKEFFYGMIGVKGERGTIWPVWCWHKKI